MRKLLNKLTIDELRKCYYDMEGNYPDEKLSKDNLIEILLLMYKVQKY